MSQIKVALKIFLSSPANESIIRKEYILKRPSKIINISAPAIARSK